MALNAAGQVEISTPLGSFTDDLPIAWQEGPSGHSSVSAAFDMGPDNSGFGFQLGAYDPTQTLVLDPLILLYCGYIGGASEEFGRAIAVDGMGNAYVLGNTFSSEFTFPVVGGPDVTYNGSEDVFVAKINPAGTALVYAGYIGGADTDYGKAIAVDAAGNAYVLGYTFSSEATFPVVGGPDLTFNGGNDVFVAKVNPAGTALLYAGYIGGTGYGSGADIAVDGAGNAYVTGSTSSDQATFPVVGGPDLTFNGDYDAFVAKINPPGTALVYAGYIGGAGGSHGEGKDFGEAIAVDAAGNAYVTGTTNSDEATFPVITGPDVTFNITPNCYGCMDAFVAKVSPTGTALVYAGYIGGAGGWDSGTDIAVDGAGNAYVTGGTNSDQATFPVSGGPDVTYNGDGDAFVAKVKPDGTALVYAGYIGGAGGDGGSGIAVDAAGNAYVTGDTNSDEATFPVSDGPDLIFSGFWDAFVAKVNPAGTALLYAGYIGGAYEESGSGIAVDVAGNAYVTGHTGSDSDSFPVAGGPDLGLYGDRDAFVAKIGKGTRLAARRAISRPSIDGNLTEWQALDQTLLNRNTASTITGSQTNPSTSDLSAGLRVVWGSEALYFAAGITDDIVVGNNSSQIWGDDTIELGIRVGSTTHQFTLAVDGRTTDQGNSISSLTVATRTVPGGWTVEIAVPVAALGLTRLRAGQEYPFTFGLWDDDLWTYPGQTHMIWRGTSTSTYSPEWEILRLSNETYTFWAKPTSTPTATSTATATPSQTPTASATPTRMSTTMPTATSTATSTPTRTRTPTAIQMLTPAATPTRPPRQRIHRWLRQHRRLRRRHPAM